MRLFLKIYFSLSAKFNGKAIDIGIEGINLENNL
jgi:hypothetical protein